MQSLPQRLTHILLEKTPKEHHIDWKAFSQNIGNSQSFTNSVLPGSGFLASDCLVLMNFPYLSPNLQTLKTLVRSVLKIWRRPYNLDHTIKVNMLESGDRQWGGRSKLLFDDAVRKVDWNHAMDINARSEAKVLWKKCCFQSSRVFTSLLSSFFILIEIFLNSMNWTIWSSRLAKNHLVWLFWDVFLEFARN